MILPLLRSLPPLFMPPPSCRQTSHVTRNPAVEEQAIDRIHRLGQLNEVSVKRFVVSGTVEDKMLALQVRGLGIYATCTMFGFLQLAPTAFTD